MDIHEIMSGLKKRVNVSTAPEKTMERTREIWTSFKNVQKQEMLSLADVTSATAHNTYKKGHISAPLALSMAQVAGINPGYLTGLSSTRGRFTEKTVKNFLLANGYRLPDGMAMEDEAAEPIYAEPAEERICAEDDMCDAAAADMLDGEQLTALLNALVIKSTICDSARRVLGQVQQLLLK